VKRISVVGNSGSGKTTLGRALAARLDVPFVELDSIYHQADWAPLPREQYRQRVAAIVAGDGWVVDGNYSAVRDLIWARADTVVWIDLPRARVMRQLLTRTLARTLSRRELWNGNREPMDNLFRLDPERSILRWAWKQHGKYARRYSEASLDPLYRHLTFIRVRSRADARKLASTH
jgi:adenylate kinase family enzyme